MTSLLETFRVFLRLGLTSFGGPVAHLGYFREEFVVRRKWIDEKSFIDLVALCQFLPGPSSSQVNLAIGLHRRGWSGALVAWLGFTLPSAILMTAFGYGVGFLGDSIHSGWLAGLKLAATAVVAQAVWAMATRFCSELSTAIIGIMGAIVAIVWQSSLNQLVIIALGLIIGCLLFHDQVKLSDSSSTRTLQLNYGRRFGLGLLVLFFVLLLGLPILSSWLHIPLLSTFDSFYRAGSLVFGGGHVVLPLLKTAVVDPGWVDNNRFLAGYGVAQAVPGPLFSFAAYLGAIMGPNPHGCLGALWCLFALYVPAALLIFGALPFWEKLRRQTGAQAALKGANAAVIGILLAALYHPIWSTSVHNLKDFTLGLTAFIFLVLLKWPPWLVVTSSALAGWMFLR